MHSYKAYLSRIFQMPDTDGVLQEEFDAIYNQLNKNLPPDMQGLLLALMEKQSQIQTHCCICSFVEGYELAIGIEWKQP